MPDTITSNKESKTILYVEDSPQMLTLIPRLLKPYNLKVETARDYNEGVIALEGEGGFSGVNMYAALLLDQHLPEKKTGLELAELAKTMGYDKPIIIISGMGLNREENEYERLQKIGGKFVLKQLDNLEKIVNIIEGRVIP